MLRRLLFVLLIVAGFIPSYAQSKKVILQINPALFSYPSKHDDSTARERAIALYLNQCHARGYVNARVEKRLFSGDTLLLVMQHGKQWIWKELKYNQPLKQVLSANRRKWGQAESAEINVEKLEEKIQLVLDYCENHGYPFAELFFDSVKYDVDGVSATMVLELHQAIVFDSIRVQEPLPVSKKFLSSYLGIREGDLYSEKQLRAIDSRIAELPFLRLKENPKVQFSNDQAQLLLKLDRKNANRFDGLLGFQPNGPNNEAQLVGQVQLSLLNAIKRAEKFDFEFRAQPNQTRDLRVNLNYPYFLNLPFGLSADLMFRRQDSTFSIFNRAIGISYLASAFNALKVSYRLEESNLLSTSAFEGSSTLPTILDVKKNVYGVSWSVDAFNYRPNPSKGYRFALGIEAAFRTIDKNTAFADSLYKDVALESNQYIAKGNASAAWTLIPKQVVFVSYQAAALVAEQLFLNELYRIGGINTVRGFNEESIFSSSYFIQNLEYRYLFDKNSFLRVFYDFGISQNKVIKQQLLLHGIGAGMQVETGIGILQLNYAIGAQNQSGFDLRTSKVHFGLINYF